MYKTLDRYRTCNYKDSQEENPPLENEVSISTLNNYLNVMQIIPLWDEQGNICSLTIIAFN
jgi:hypothetical protein